MFDFRIIAFWAIACLILYIFAAEPLLQAGDNFKRHDTGCRKIEWRCGQK